jgi:heme-degrading monooxygenase HmoA
MIAVIFEVWPRDEEHKQEYLDIAAQLRPLLDNIEGFISIERFESLSEPGKLLSFSLWRDEQAVDAWRQLGEHRAAQEKGRANIFQNYRLRIVSMSMIRNYGMLEREQAPLDSRQLHG